MPAKPEEPVLAVLDPDSYELFADASPPSFDTPVAADVMITDPPAWDEIGSALPLQFEHHLARTLYR